MTESKCVDRVRLALTGFKMLRNYRSHSKVISSYRGRCEVRTVWPVSSRLYHLWAECYSWSEKRDVEMPNTNLYYNRLIQHLKFLKWKYNYF